MLAWVQSSILWQYFLSYANILKIKRRKRYHLKVIGSLLYSYCIDLINIHFDQETEKEKMIRLEPRLASASVVL